MASNLEGIAEVARDYLLTALSSKLEAGELTAGDIASAASKVASLFFFETSAILQISEGARDAGQREPYVDMQSIARILG
jgi:hypothetical protein